MDSSQENDDCTRQGELPSNQTRGANGKTYEDEVTPDICCACLVACISVIKVSHIIRLQYQHNCPIDGDHDAIERKWARVSIILTPYCMTFVVTMLATIIRWFIESIISTRNDEQEPCHNCKNFVSDEISLAKLLSFGERVIWRCQLLADMHQELALVQKLHI